jgi:hypothetical protein
MKIRAIIFGFALLLLPACHQQKNYISDPEAQIVRELSRRRIVMLGDFAHECPLPFYTLTSTLSTWLTMLEKGESNQHHLTLFLEDDNQVANLLRHYVKTGDINPMLDFILPSATLERLEFYSDLRRIATRIDSMNRVLPPSKQIIFDIQGPEAMNVFDARALNSSDSATTLYFVRDRDSLAAMNIITYLHEHPDHKGLIFYGSGHLIKNIVTKPFTEALTPEESKGVFLANYLKREYGDNQVFTITQVVEGRSPINYFEFGGTDIMILANDVPWKDSPPNDNNFIPANFDAFIIRTEFVVPGHPWTYVFSKRILTSSIKRMEFLDPYLPGVFALRFYREAVRALLFLSDTNCLATQDWRRWCNAHPFIDVERLRSDEFRKWLADQYYRTHETTVHFQDFENLGFDLRTGNPRTMSRGEWDKMFENMWPQVVFLNSIGTYWIGDSTEQARAKDYLVKSSGQNYDDPGMYLKWWRKEYFKVAY